jgi:CubicO group peptidase (beta-lactamase class C family)
MPSTNDRLPRSTPESQGISSGAILSFLDAVEQEKLELHSLMIVRHGQVVAEGWWTPYGADQPHMMFSLSKSFTSTAIGFAVQEGLLSIDASVVSFFPEDAPANPSAHLAGMQVRHLLCMGTGHAKETMDWIRKHEGKNWVKGFLSAPVEHPPGTQFLYNNGASYMLSAIIQKVTGQTLLDYLQTRLLEPLGIKGASWETCPQGINKGGWGLSLRTEDIAKFGQLYLQKGMWQGNRILSEAWVEEATFSHISNGDGGNSDWKHGYGYQFWRCQKSGVYRGDGAFGQFCIVMPEQDAVVAITSAVSSMQHVLNQVWKHLLPAMGASPQPQDAELNAQLVERLSQLAIAPPRLKPEAPYMTHVAGNRYDLEQNELGIEAIAFQFRERAVGLSVHKGGTVHQLTCGINEWIIETTRLLHDAGERVAASAAWAEDDSLVLSIRFMETPFCLTYACTFKDNEVRMELSQNVGMDERSVMIGRVS